MIYLLLALFIGLFVGSFSTRRWLQRPRPPTEIRRSGTAAYQDYKRALNDV